MRFPRLYLCWCGGPYLTLLFGGFLMMISRWVGRELFCVSRWFKNGTQRSVVKKTMTKLLNFYMGVSKNKGKTPQIIPF